MKKFVIATIALIALLSISTVYYFISQKPNPQVNDNKLAHIVFTTDNSYKDYLQVAIKSAIENKNPDSIYDIHVLCVDLSDKDMEEFKTLEDKNVTITPKKETLESIKEIGQYEVANYVSRADLFKFFMPQIFKDFDKILYIDSDVLILGDLLDLYNTDIHKVYLGAVLKYKYAYYWKKEFGLFWKRNPILAYNCGVMLLNLKKMRNDNISEKLIAEKNSDTKRNLMTQDAFNKAIPVEKTVQLSPFYNAISRWKDKSYKVFGFKTTYKPYLDNIDSMEELFEHAVIIHYAGSLKPWNSDEVRFYDEWWKYAKMLDKEIKKIPVVPKKQIL